MRKALQVQVLDRRCTLTRLTIDAVSQLGSLLVFRSQKNFRLSYPEVVSRSFEENFDMLKNCPTDFYKIWHNRFTTEGSPGAQWEQT